MIAVLLPPRDTVLLHGIQAAFHELGKERITVFRERLTNCTVDGVAGFRRLVAGDASAGRKFSDSIDRKIGQAREHRAEVVADR